MEMRRAGLAHHGANPRTLAHSVAGRLVSGFLAMDDRLDRVEVLAWMAGAPVVDRDGVPIPLTWWTRLSARAGVVRGPRQWRQRLLRYAAEVGLGPPGGAQPGRNAEVQRHPTHQKAWLLTRAFQDPGQHRGRGGFAMRARHGQHMAPLQDMLAEPLGAAGIGGATVQNGFHQGELGAAVGQARPAHDVADDVQVRLQRQLVGAVALDQVDAQCAQLVAHGRVNACVAARDAVARRARQCGQPAHEGSANAQDMDVHG